MQKIVFFVYASVALFMALGGIVAVGLLGLEYWLPGVFIHVHEYFSGGLWLDAILILLFGLQHSIMARPAFKNAMRKAIPSILVSSNYVMMSGFCLLLLAGFWVRSPEPLYDFRGTIIWWVLLGFTGIGAFLVAWAGKVMNGAELLGLDVIQTIVSGKIPPPTPFITPGPYRFMRHPIYTGLLLMLWAVPVGSLDHLIFAGGFSFYLVVGVHFEERDLVGRFGQAYLDYQSQVPKFFPWPGKVARLG